jgi:hypothetical protein
MTPKSAASLRSPQVRHRADILYISADRKDNSFFDRIVGNGRICVTKGRQRLRPAGSA